MLFSLPCQLNYETRDLHIRGGTWWYTNSTGTKLPNLPSTPIHILIHFYSNFLFFSFILYCVELEELQFSFDVIIETSKASNTYIDIMELIFFRWNYFMWLLLEFFIASIFRYVPDNIVTIEFRFEIINKLLQDLSCI